MEDIGGKIAKIREQKGISQRELSRRLNINPSFINRIEKGTKTPNLKLLQQIADVLDVDFNLFNEEAYTPAEKELLNDLELTDDELINKYNLTVDGKKVSDREMKLLLDQIRNIREFYGE